MSINEDLRAQSIKEKVELDGKIAELERTLADERAKSIEEKAGLEKELEEEKTKSAGLQKELEEEKAKSAGLEKELEEEKTRSASERIAYPDLCVATVEQFKGSVDFQMAIDAVIASNLARKRVGGAGPSGAIAGGRSEEEVIQSFQWSDFYKHEIAEFWDSGLKMFKRKVEELFPDLDFSSAKIDDDDMAQTPLDEGVEEEDLVSSEEE
ncbi:hypothetical protein CsSME_00005076 [Camellia sinensis var. sinensis]